MSDEIILEAEVPDHLAGKRLDVIAAELFSDYSRGRLQRWIKDGDLLVDGETKKPKEKLLGGEHITIVAEPEAEGDWVAEPVDFDVVYEDDHLLVINKPAGLVVHPAAGHASGTLVNGLIHRHPEQIKLPRAGIVHRLDKDTTGLMVVARNLTAHTSLVQQLQEKTVQRHYQAIVVGAMTGGGAVDQPIARHPSIRTRMAVVPTGKPAVTHYRLKKRFRGHSHIELQLETGRTHQIRVHMSYLHYPLVGDPLYGGRMKIPAGATADLIDALRQFKRQALHAFRLGLEHPDSGEEVEWEVPLPKDFQDLLLVLEQDL